MDLINLNTVFKVIKRTLQLNNNNKFIDAN